MEVRGEPAEAALLVAAAKASIFRENFPMQIIGEIPFDPRRRLMSVITQDSGAAKLTLSKGDPQLLLEQSRYYLTEKGIELLTTTIAGKWLWQSKRWDKRPCMFWGLPATVLRKRQSVKKHDFRRTCRNTRATVARSGGIGAQLPPGAGRPVMITGDLPDTACAVAKELKLYHSERDLLTGRRCSRCRMMNCSGVFCRRPCSPVGTRTRKKQYSGP